MAIAIVQTKAIHRAGAVIPAGSPSPKPYVSGELPLPAFSGTGAAGQVAWSDGEAGGSFSPAVTANGAQTAYTPPNESRQVTVTGTDTANGANTGQTLLTVESTLPLNPATGYETDTDQDTEVSLALDKTPVSATFGPPFDGTPLTWNGRNSVQWAMLRAHWLYHRKVTEFWFVDQETGETYKVRWDSALRQRKNGANNFDMSGSVRGRR